MIALAPLLVLAAPLVLAATQSPPAAAPSPLATVTIFVDASQGRREISPWLYGRNGDLTRKEERTLSLEAGVRIVRSTGGNNMTKYNWRNDLSTHPDWFQNVYRQHWPERAKAIQATPGIDGLFGLPVLGWVAKTDRYNYPDWTLDREGKRAHESLAGGGCATLYLEPQTPEGSAALLDHWLSPGGLALSATRFTLWHLDNEPNCWRGTHKDVSGTLMTGGEAVARFAAVAREVKARHPEILLMAPGFASEWYWWDWSDNSFVEGLPWTEFFIKRMAEESRKFGRNLIDLVDVHIYSSYSQSTDEDCLNEHRLWYDPGYEFPGANGVRGYPSGWDNNRKVEMLFARIEGWIDKYFGPDSGVGIGVTESGLESKKPMVWALWYASTLGVFADHGVRVFTPWYWTDPMWEVLHLWSRHAQRIRVAAGCSGEPKVSCYASVSVKGDRMTLILVNRDGTAARQASIALTGFRPKAGPATVLRLANLPDQKRTFVSRQKNALTRGTAKVSGESVGVTLPPWSITAVILTGKPAAVPAR
ncbi:MAG: glycoside hydrolase family 44 protein [Candidatus Coatesbacteria bacterium]